MMLRFDKYFRVLQVSVIFMLMFVFFPISTMAMQYLDTLEMEILFAERAYLKSDFGEPQPEDGEIIALGVKVLDIQLMQQIVGITNKPVLVIGNHKLSYPIHTGGRLRTGQFVLVFHLTDIAQIQEGDKVFLYMLSSIMFRDEPIERIHPQFSYDIVVDKRWKVFGGMIEDSQSNVVPYTTLKITGGNTLLTRTLVKKGSRSVFSLVQGEGEPFFMEANTTYVVEVLAKEVVLFSQTLTRKTAAYPRWEIKLDTPVDYYEINGYVYDSSGNPLPEVTLTVDEYHTVTTDENGYYQIPYFFAGNYTLVASKEGYHFSPVEFTVGEGQPPVTIDLVEKRANQCLLYAVHDTAGAEAQLLTVDFSEEELEITPLGWKPDKPEISLVVGNFEGDEQEEIVTAAQKGHHTITLSELNGQTIRTFSTPLSGMLLAAGDLDGDGQAEIIAASRSANRSTVNVYTADSTALEPIRLFDQNTRMAPAVGDLDGDGFDEIIAGSLLKEDQVAIYNSVTQERQVFSVFQAESRLRKKDNSSGKAKGCDKKSQGNRCDDDHVSKEKAPKEPQMELKNDDHASKEKAPKKPQPEPQEDDHASKEKAPNEPKTEPTNDEHSEEDDHASKEKAPKEPKTEPQEDDHASKGKAPKGNQYGVQVATGDFNGDGKDEIVALMASKGSRVEIYNADGSLQSGFTAFDSQKGLVVTVGNVIGDEQPEIIVGEAKGNLIRGFSVSGEQLFELEAINSGTVSSMAVFGCLEE
jgi:hypothetical protein